MQEAMFYTKDKNARVRCQLCPHLCYIKEGQVGICKIRKCVQGRLLATAYGNITALAIDPIEKKPLYHYYPGRNILSVGSYSCNLACAFCQNHGISQEVLAAQHLEVKSLVLLAKDAQKQGSIGVAFTYNEPIINIEYLYHSASLLKEQGLKSVMVTNAFIEKKPLKFLLPYIDAFNVDLKAFNEGFYQKVCKGNLQSVKNSISEIAGHSHLEVTTLLIPEENDSEKEIGELAKFLSQLDPDIVLHLSRYHPAYNYTKEATLAKSLLRAREIAKEHLNYVYIGNLPEVDNDTYCLNCSLRLISRYNYTSKVLALKANKCKYCHKLYDKIIY